MAELAYAYALGAYSLRIRGSNPLEGTIKKTTMEHRELYSFGPSFFGNSEIARLFFDQKPEDHFPAGKQTEVTENVRTFAQRFSGLTYPQGFQEIYKSIFNMFTILRVYGGKN